MNELSRERSADNLSLQNCHQNSAASEEIITTCTNEVDEDAEEESAQVLQALERERPNPVLRALQSCLPALRLAILGTYGLLFCKGTPQRRAGQESNQHADENAQGLTQPCLELQDECRRG